MSTKTERSGPLDLSTGGKHVEHKRHASSASDADNIAESRFNHDDFTMLLKGAKSISGVYPDRTDEAWDAFAAIVSTSPLILLRSAHLKAESPPL
jgi:hypothetical protein